MGHASPLKCMPSIIVPPRNPILRTTLFMEVLFKLFDAQCCHLSVRVPKGQKLQMMAVANPSRSVTTAVLESCPASLYRRAGCGASSDRSEEEKSAFPLSSSTFYGPLEKRIACDFITVLYDFVTVLLVFFVLFFMYLQCESKKSPPEGS